jgi:hypothetical protein
MIKYILAFLTVMVLVGGSSASFAAEETITCALSRAYDCYPDEGCKEWSIDEMALPRFVRIDLKNKIITSLDKAITQTSKISAIDTVDGLIVMHGTELRGWTITLGEESRNITLSAAGDGDGFMVFGVCMDK